MQIKNIKKIERKEPSGLTFYVDNREGVTRPSEGLSLRNFFGSLDQRLGSFFYCFGCLFYSFLLQYFCVFKLFLRFLFLDFLVMVLVVMEVCFLVMFFKALRCSSFGVFLVVFGNGGEREERMSLFSCSCVLRLGLEVLENGCLYRQRARVCVCLKNG